MFVKSDSSYTRRSSITPSSEAGQRRAHSTASSFDFTWIIQYPPSSSLASVKGPSVTVGLPPEKVTRAPLALGCRPSRPSRTPALVSSWMKAPIFAMCSAVGGRFLAGLYSASTFMVLSPC